MSMKSMNNHIKKDLQSKEVYDNNYKRLLDDNIFQSYYFKVFKERNFENFITVKEKDKINFLIDLYFFISQHKLGFSKNYNNPEYMDSTPDFKKPNNHNEEKASKSPKKKVRKFEENDKESEIKADISNVSPKTNRKKSNANDGAQKDKGKYKITISQEFLDLYSKLNNIKSAKVKQDILSKLKAMKTDFEFDSLQELEEILTKYRLPENEIINEDLFNSNDFKSILNNLENKLERTHAYESNELNKYLKEDDKDEISNRTQYDKSIKSKAIKKTQNSNFFVSIKTDANLKDHFVGITTVNNKELEFDIFADINPIKSVNNGINNYGSNLPPQSDESSSHLSKRKFKNNNKILENNYLGKYEENISAENEGAEEEEPLSKEGQKVNAEHLEKQPKEMKELEKKEQDESFNTAYINKNKHLAFENRLHHENNAQQSKVTLRKNNSSASSLFHKPTQKQLLKNNSSAKGVQKRLVTKSSKKLTILFENDNTNDIYIGKDLVDKIFSCQENQVVQFSYNELNKVGALLLDYLKTEREKAKLSHENSVLKDENQASKKNFEERIKKLSLENETSIIQSNKVSEKQLLHIQKENHEMKQTKEGEIHRLNTKISKLQEEKLEIYENLEKTRSDLKKLKRCREEQSLLVRNYVEYIHNKFKVIQGEDLASASADLNIMASQRENTENMSDSSVFTQIYLNNQSKKSLAKPQGEKKSESQFGGANLFNKHSEEDDKNEKESSSNSLYYVRKTPNKGSLR